MRNVALVTDTTAGLPPAAAAALGVTVVPASFAFDEERFLDSEGPGVFERMRDTGKAPRSFGVAEAAFSGAFRACLEETGAVLAVLTPFDVNPSFTTACAAMLAIQFDTPDAAIKVSNAGVGGAGLGALVVTLAQLANAGASMAELLGAIDELEPQCDSLCVPGDTHWLGQAGKLATLEERLGPLEGRVPLVRLGTRFTGVAAFDDAQEALEAAIERLAGRAGDSRLNVCIAHAGEPACAERVAEALRHRWPVASLEIGTMSATHGSQLGPGTIGLGACPAGKGS